MQVATMAPDQVQVEDDNKNLVYRFITEAWNHENFGLIDSLFTSDYVVHLGGRDLKGSPAGVKEYLLRMHLAFPDFHMSLNHLMSEGDIVAAHLVNTGTQQGEYKVLAMPEAYPPSGKRMEYMEVGIFRIQNGKIAEAWFLSDTLAMMQQIGMIPS